MPRVAVLALNFQFQCHVSDAVFLQFRPDVFLDLVGIAVCDDVHGGAVVLTVQTADVDVVDIEDAERAVEKRKNERAQNQNTPQGTGGDFSSFNTDAFFEAALKRSARELEPTGAGSDGGKE